MPSAPATPAVVPVSAARDSAQFFAARVTAALTRIVALDPAVIEPILVALVARGHVLIEGVPGVGKTLLARTLARTVDC